MKAGIDQYDFILLAQHIKGCIASGDTPYMKLVVPTHDHDIYNIKKP